MLFTEMAKLWAPPPEMTAAEWAEEYRYLSPESCPAPGKYHGAVTPYAKDVLDAFNDPNVERVVVMSSAQVGKSTILENVIGYFMAHDPCPIMVVLPTDEMLQSFSKERFAPMIRDTPALTPLVSDNKSKDGGNTISSKMFPGGHIAMVSARSAPQLQSRPRRIVLFDEVDRYEQGDPIGHGGMRTARYWNRKIGLFSTPERKEDSKIERAFMEGTQEQWELPCPNCGEYQPLMFNGQLDHASCMYACRICGAQAGEYAWKGGKGRWQAGRSLAESAKTRSFRLNALMAPGLHWEEIIARYESAQRAYRQGDIEPYRIFITQILGEPYEEQGEEISDETFVAHTHWYNCDIPAGVKLLFAQVDVQDNRIEVELRGFGAGFEQWGIMHLVIHGTIDMPHVQGQLDVLLNRTWTREDGRQMGISRMVIDSGGHYTDFVYAFTRQRHPRACAIKGSSVYSDPISDKASAVGKHDTPLFVIGVTEAKETTFHRLKVARPGPGYCHWPADTVMSDGTPRGYTEEYFKQLSSEKRVERYTNGRRYTAWVLKRKGLANEAWDLMIYGLAAAHIYGPLALEAAETTPAAPARGIRQVGRGVKHLVGG